MNCRDKSLTALARKVNPFTAPACTICGLKGAHRHTPPNSVFDGPVTNLLIIVCILTEILSSAHAKGAQKKREKRSLNAFKFGTFVGRFPSDGVASRAVKGLRALSFCIIYTL